jgi:serine protease AprX
MKYLYFLLFPVITFSQNLMERDLMVQSYDKYKVNNLISRNHNKKIEQSKLINDFKMKSKVIDSEFSSLQKIINGIPYYYTIYNNASAITIGVNELYSTGSLGLNLSGSSMFAGVWDGGKVRDTHVEFKGRVSIIDGSGSLSDHATHVTGTIIASGVSPLRRGIAYQANALTNDWNSDIEEMTNFASQGYLVSNHSYGYALTPSSSKSIFGSYDDSSQEIDDLSNTFPYYQVVYAAGNDRSDFTLPQIQDKLGFDMLTGASCSKNSIVVAAVDKVVNYFDNTSVVMSPFSNYGPTDDGRVKPDISAQGVGVSSTTSTANTSYGVNNGTSMAAPAITGLILLLQEHYNNFNFSKYMKASMVRGLILHTANEAGSGLGPDYEFGWGVANGKKASQIISNANISNILEMNVLNQNSVFTKTMTNNTVQSLNVTICWTDPTGNQNTANVIDERSSRLVNNLDLKVFKDGVVYYPWKLDVNNPQSPATNNSDNDVDNIEKVFIENAEPGTYTIQVSHKGTLLTGNQEFSLIADGQNGLTLASSNFEKDNSIKLYPNPAQETLFFDLPVAFLPTDIAIYDITGKLISSFKYEQKNNIKVLDLTAGMYFIKFISPDRTINLNFLKK